MTCTTASKESFTVKPNKLTGMIGLCRKAGKVVCGTPLVCLALREKRKPCLVPLPSQAGASTEQKVRYKCEYYRVPLCTLPLTTEELATSVGKGGEMACVAITDDGFAKAILTAAESTGKDGAVKDSE